jgi:trk system potassium uptake protein TrkA
VGKTVKEAAKIFPQLHFVPIAIQRFGTQYTLIPRGDTQFKEGDQVYFITVASGVDELYKLTGKVKQTIKNVMILGGSKIGKKTASDLSLNNFNVKLIENNREKAFDLADELPNILVINSDGRNVELLEEENIHDMDAFIAVTDDEESNIISCLMAKHLDVKKTVALVSKPDFIPLAQTIGLDAVVNKKVAASNEIHRYVRSGQVISVTELRGIKAEVIELLTAEKSKVVGKKIQDIKLPDGCIIGGVLCQGSVEIATGKTVINANDRVMVFCLPEAIDKVTKLFSNG